MLRSSFIYFAFSDMTLFLHFSAMSHRNIQPKPAALAAGNDHTAIIASTGHSAQLASQIQLLSRIYGTQSTFSQSSVMSQSQPLPISSVPSSYSAQLPFAAAGLAFANTSPIVTNQIGGSIPLAGSGAESVRTQTSYALPPLIVRQQTTASPHTSITWSQPIQSVTLQPNVIIRGSALPTITTNDFKRSSTIHHQARQASRRHPHLVPSNSNTSFVPLRRKLLFQPARQPSPYSVKQYPHLLSPVPLSTLGQPPPAHGFVKGTTSQNRPQTEPLDLSAAPLEFTQAADADNVPVNLATVERPPLITTDLNQICLPTLPEKVEPVSPATRYQLPDFVPELSSQADEIDMRSPAETETAYQTFSSVDYPTWEWDKYLKETGTQSAPSQCFQHVEYSLDSALQTNMLVEASYSPKDFTKEVNQEEPNSNDSKIDETETFWFASIQLICGPVFKLRWLGCPSAEHDFWRPTSTLHAVGHAEETKLKLSPPLTEWSDAVDTDDLPNPLAPAQVLTGEEPLLPIDAFTEGLCLEVHDCLNPSKLWFATIIKNYSGRLLLRYVGTEDIDADFYLFYLSQRLRKHCWCKNQESDTTEYVYSAPEGLNLSNVEVKQFIDKVLNESHPLPESVFQYQEKPGRHSFTAGQKLEAINPRKPSNICPATIHKTIDSYYFIVKIDSYDDSGDEILSLCHGRSPGLFPVGWCDKNNIILTPPGRSDSGVCFSCPFEWSTYLSLCQATSAPERCFPKMGSSDHGFERGMKLEAVNPSNPHSLSCATISRVVGCYLWINLDSQLSANHIVHCKSFDIFPHGWAQSNRISLDLPRLPICRPCPKRISRVCRMLNADAKLNNEPWCPKIYVNHKCQTGNLICKARLAMLPKFVGPGLLTLTVKQIIKTLVNCGYSPSQVLRALRRDGEPNPHMTQAVIKAKSYHQRGKRHRAIVELCSRVDQLDEFLRQVCVVLECCPNLLSLDPTISRKGCPERCHVVYRAPHLVFSRNRFSIFACGTEGLGAPPDLRLPEPNGQHCTGQHCASARNTDPTGKHRISAAENQLDIDVEMERIRRRTWGPRAATPAPHNNSIVYTQMETRSSKAQLASSDPNCVPSANLSNNDDSNQCVPNSSDFVPTKITTRRKQKKYSIDTFVEQQRGAGEKSPKRARAVSNIMKRRLRHLRTINGTPDPALWSVGKVCHFINKTDCRLMVPILRSEEIDGVALLLLDHETLVTSLNISHLAAAKLMKIIRRLRIAHFKYKWCAQKFA